MSKQVLETVPEQPFNETQQRILDAAIQCLKKWGIEKTNLNDIAKQAGVTRPTVYSYFPNKGDVIRTALLQSGYAFGAKLVQHIGQFECTGDRLLEAVVYAIEKLPKEPYLTVITQADLSSTINQGALTDEEGFAICLDLFRYIFKHSPPGEQDLAEITEFTIRVALSLLILKGPAKRTGKELRGLLERRLLPGLGL
jgi:AcrR family transcriptional regulator